MPPSRRVGGDAPDERSPLLSKRKDTKITSTEDAGVIVGASASTSTSNGEASRQKKRSSSIASDEESLDEADVLLDRDGNKILPPPGARVAPDELEDALDPVKRRRHTLRWGAFWLLFGTFTIVLVVLAVKKGGAKFDFKDALKKAAGGVSGASIPFMQRSVLMLHLPD